MSKPKWDRDRPVKPDVDPLYLEVTNLMKMDSRSTYAKANVSGLSTATINNWCKFKVRRPQSVSLQMAAKMLGYEITLVPREEKKNSRVASLPKARAARAR